MIILVTMRTVENPGYSETRDAISHDWGRFFQRFDLTPILVPNAVDDVERFFRLGAAGLLLTGGDDLGPAGSPTARDRTEAGMLQGAIRLRLPVFGTCRGLQMINCYFGGSLRRELPEKHVGEHAVCVKDVGMLRVNSFHNQGVVSDGVAPELEAFAQTDSGVVEAVRHCSLPITAVQWHPERFNPAADFDQKLISEWLAQCA